MHAVYLQQKYNIYYTVMLTKCKGWNMCLILNKWYVFMYQWLCISMKTLWITQSYYFARGAIFLFEIKNFGCYITLLKNDFM